MVVRDSNSAFRLMKTKEEFRHFLYLSIHGQPSETHGLHFSIGDYYFVLKLDFKFVGSAAKIMQNEKIGYLYFVFVQYIGSFKFNNLNL